MSAPVTVLQPLARASAIKGVMAGAVITQPMNMSPLILVTSIGVGSASFMPMGVAFTITDCP